MKPFITRYTWIFGRTNKHTTDESSCHKLIPGLNPDKVKFNKEKATCELQIVN